MPRGERAQSVGIANFFLALLVGAILTWIITAVTDPLMASARDRATDSVANTALDWSATLFTNFPLMWLLTSFFSLVALSVFQRELRS